MFAIHETAPGGPQSSSTQLQMQLIASQAQAQRVAAMASGDQSGTAGMNTSGGREGSAQLLRAAVLKSGAQRALDSSDATRTPRKPTAQSPGAEPRSIIEAQEVSQTATAVTAAFQARFAITDLLSVIRDPNDNMLPRAPKKQAAAL